MKRSYRQEIFYYQVLWQECLVILLGHRDEQIHTRSVQAAPAVQNHIKKNKKNQQFKMKPYLSLKNNNNKKQIGTGFFGKYVIHVALHLFFSHLPHSYKHCLGTCIALMHRNKLS